MPPARPPAKQHIITLTYAYEMPLSTIRGGAAEAESSSISCANRSAHVLRRGARISGPVPSKRMSPNRRMQARRERAGPRLPRTRRVLTAQGGSGPRAHWGQCLYNAVRTWGRRRGSFD